MCLTEYDEERTMRPLGEDQNMYTEIKEAVIKAAESLPEGASVREYVLNNLEEVVRIKMAEERARIIMEFCMEEGRKEGLEEGTDQTRLANIRSLMEKWQMTAEEAMDILGIPSEVHAKYVLMLNEKDFVNTDEFES